MSPEVVKDDKFQESGIVESATPMLSYLADVLMALKHLAEKEVPHSPSVPVGDGDLLLQDLDSDWGDDLGGDDEDSGGEESVSF